MSWGNEKLRRALAWKLDKAQMMRDAGFEPDPHQLEFMDCYAQNALMLWSRQTGKTRSLATEVEHTACYDPGDIVIIAGERQGQAFEVFDRAQAMHEDLLQLGELPSTRKADNELFYSNGSRVLALPSTVESIRGYTAKLVIIDEAAFTDDLILGKVAPMLVTTGGRLICASTTNGARGWFYEAWQSTDGGWVKFKALASDVKRITAAELARQELLLGPFKFRQEFGLEFIDGAQQYFPTEMIEAALCDDIEPLFPNLAMAA